MTKKLTTPAPITEEDCRSLVFLKEASLSGVAYHYLPAADEDGYAGGEKGVDCDLAAVELNLGDGNVAVITWAMTGEFEGLAVLRGQRYVGVGSEVLDASDREAWRDKIDQEIVSVAASWQVSGEECPESLWAIRLNFASGSVTVALGTAPNLEYMPDELVVVYSELIARSYKPRHVSDSAWGKPLRLTGNPRPRPR